MKKNLKNIKLSTNKLSLKYNNDNIMNAELKNELKELNSLLLNIDDKIDNNKKGDLPSNYFDDMEDKVFAEMYKMNNNMSKESNFRLLKTEKYSYKNLIAASLGVITIGIVLFTFVSKNNKSVVLSKTEINKYLEFEMMPIEYKNVYENRDGAIDKEIETKIANLKDNEINSFLEMNDNEYLQEETEIN